MLKRVLAAVLAMAIAFSICACGNAIPDNLSKETYTLGKKALNVMDKYLAGKIDEDKASDQLSSIHDQLEEEYDSLTEQANAGDTQALLYQFYNGSVSLCISSFAMGMYGDANAYGNTYDCQSMRDKLAEYLGLD